MAAHVNTKFATSHVSESSSPMPRSITSLGRLCASMNASEETSISSSMDMKSALPRSPSATVRARVPASTANLGPGFDVFSIALESPRIEVEFTPADAGTRTIIVEGAHASEINTDPGMNPSGKAFSALFDEFGKPEGYVLRIRAGIPPCKDLGLSGAEAVGAIVCADRHFDLGLRGRALVNIAAKAEPSHHMDNVSASALGGFNIVAGNSFDEIGPITFPPPKDLGLAVLVPNVEKPSTEAARQLVPSQVQTAEYVRSIGHAARISAAFAKGDVQAILEALPWDTIVEPCHSLSNR